MAKRLRAESPSDPVHLNDSEALKTPSTDAKMGHTPKYASLELPEHPSDPTMQCLLPPHLPKSFNSHNEYESHYQQSHTNRCSACKANLPSPHFLELHIAENHDPIAAARRERGEKTYACFVEGCEKICLVWQKRRSHLVDKHGYPRNYDFFVVNTGIDGKRSMLRNGVDAQGHRKSSRERRVSSVTNSTLSTEATSVSANAPSTVGSGESAVKAKACRSEAMEEMCSMADVDNLTRSMSSLKMVPRSISFGKRKALSGFAKK